MDRKRKYESDDETTSESETNSDNTKAIHGHV